MPFQNNVLAGASGATGYEIPYSLRFRRSNSPYMTRTAGTPTNAKIATWSFWHKRGALGPEWVWGQITSGASTFFTFDSGIAATLDSIRIYVSGTNLTSTPVFRDPSAWYHFVVAVDTTQATAADRIKVYVNNQAVTMSGTITLNADITFNVSGKLLKIGDGTWFATSADYIDGYLAEFNFIDGQALTPSSFGQTDSATGVWVPKKYSGTYGNNGFYLKFADASAATATAIGKDSSGNGNNWTPSGISVTSGVTFDQMLDTPTLGYPVWNPLEYDAGLTTQSTPTFADANMKFTGTGGTNNVCTSRSSIGVKTGKWYWETVIVAISGNYPVIGVMSSQPYDRLTSASSYMGQSATTTMGYSAGGSKLQSNSLTAYGNTFAANDVISVALDLDNKKIWFAKNGTWQASGDPAAGTNAAFSGFTVPTDGISAALSGYQSTGASGNFGQRAFSYTPPTGFKALNTANLATPSIKKGSLYMDATLRTGTGATASVSSLGFQPDLVWIKSRSAATNHNLFDSTRGVQKGLGSNLQSAQYTDANSFTAFNSNGYSLGSDASSRGVNINTNTYVDWAWKESVSSGFDVVTFAGNGSAQTINHSLGVTPEFMILRVYDDTLGRTWTCWHKNLTSAAYYLPLEGTSGEILENTAFNSTAPTSTQFTAGSYNSISTKNTIAYLWAGVEGFSKFGKYTGNGSTDGPFVWCGFRPRWLFIKGGNVNSSWRQYDTSRLTYNEAIAPLLINTSGAQTTEANGIDILSNGFKIRWSDSVLNGSGSTYIFAAFAENPFKYARAR